MDLTIHNNLQVLQQIEWNQIEKKLLSFSHFKYTSDQLLTRLTLMEDVNQKIEQSQFFEKVIYENEIKDLLFDIRKISKDFNCNHELGKIRKEHTIELIKLNNLAKILELGIDHNRPIGKYYPSQVLIEDYQKFKRLAQKNFLTLFRKIVDIDGDITLENHPQIRPLYQEQLKLEQKIRESLNHTLNSSDFENKIQFNSFDVIHERYAIPIKSGSYNNNIGQIISRSESGNTLFVEPKNIASNNSKRIEIIVEIQSIIARIEKDLTLALKEFTDEIYQLSQFAYFIDEFNTRYLFNSHYELTPPSLSTEAQIDLDKAFHPLIENPVKNDIKIGKEKCGMIISGPNTGGKTATLKTLAITQLFISYGLYAPATNAKLHLYDKVFYFGNDNQDLTHGLSSFAAEVKNYSDLFHNLGETNLILIDEIFNSTSSEEASALATALFKNLKKHTKVHIVVSSHHQTLKTILHQDEEFISTHVGFDLDENKPTYILHYGSPGSSQALNIFKSMTENSPYFQGVYDQALQYLDNQVIHYEKLLDSIAAKENQLTKTLQENREINQQLKNQKKSMEGVIKLKIDEKVSQAEKKLQDITRKAENVLRQAKKGEITKARQLDQKISEVQSQLIKEKGKQKEAPKKDYSNLSKPSKIEVGKQYFCLSLEKTVTVTKIEEKRRLAHIGKGAFSLKVKFDSLRLANKRGSSEQSPQAQGGYSSTRQAKVEYDCRGMRLEEFESLINDITTDLSLGVIPYINIIHGHGTGVLKNWLRKFIKQNKDLVIVESNSGNDGETQIKLKE